MLFLFLMLFVLLVLLVLLGVLVFVQALAVPSWARSHQARCRSKHANEKA